MQTLLLIALVSGSSAVRKLTARPTSFLATAVNEFTAPQGGVAKVMSQVEQRWLNLALQATALDCETTNNAANCTTNVTKNFAVGNFTQSCHTVSKAIVQTSAGDRSRVQAYMSNVCGQEALKGKPEELCLDFSQFLIKEMSEYQHANLEGSMDLSAVCGDFFRSGYIGRYAEQERQARLQEQAAMEAEQQRKQDEEEEKKAQAEVEEKAALARERLEKMQNATAEADAKRQEAVEAAVEAQRKSEASETAVDTQKRLKQEADEAAKAAEDAKAKLSRVHERLSNNTKVEPPNLDDQTVQAEPAVKDHAENSTTNQTAEAAHKVAKSFLVVAPYTFS